MESIALLFSGQGAQRVGMGTDLAESSPAAREILDLGSGILPSDFPAVLQSGPEETLTRTTYLPAGSLSSRLGPVGRPP